MLALHSEAAVFKGDLSQAAQAVLLLVAAMPWQRSFNAYS
jgi:hypothetical protein